MSIKIHAKTRAKRIARAISMLFFKIRFLLACFYCIQDRTGVHVTYELRKMASLSGFIQVLVAQWIERPPGVREVMSLIFFAPHKIVPGWSFHLFTFHYRALSTMISFFELSHFSLEWRLLTKTHISLHPGLSFFPLSSCVRWYMQMTHSAESRLAKIWRQESCHFKRYAIWHFASRKR